MINKENFTIISNEIIKGENTLEGIELSVLIVLLMNKTNKNIITCNYDYIYKMLNVKKNNSYKINKIKDTMQQLQQKTFFNYYSDFLLQEEITNIKDLKRNELFFIEFNYDIDSDFTILYDYEIVTILNYNNNSVNNYTLLELYTYIMSCIKNNEKDIDYKCCYPSHENIIDSIDITENTLIKYLKILNELNLLVYDIAGFKETVKGQIKNSTTYYSRYDDIDNLKETLSIIRKEKGYIKLNNKSKDKSNIKRSIKQKINILNKKQNKNIIEENTLELLLFNYKQLETEKENK